MDGLFLRLLRKLEDEDGPVCRKAGIEDGNLI